MSVHDLNGHEDLAVDAALTNRSMKELFPGKKLLSVRRARNMTVGQCYGNVHRVITSEGGAPQLGWALTCWPGRFVEALFHAVWLGPNGLEDVTERPFPRCRAQTTTFVLDDSIVVPDDIRETCVDSRFVRLDSRSESRDYINATLAYTAAQKKLLSQVRELGLVFGYTAKGEIEIEPGNDATSLAVSATIQTIIARAADKHRIGTAICQGELSAQLGRNDPCHCGSGRKFKRCHGA